MKAIYRLHYWLAGAFVLFFYWANAQLPLNNPICQPIPVEFQLPNSGDSTLTQLQITFIFSSCLEWDAGSLSGATLIDSNPGILSTQVTDLPAGSQATINFTLHPSCTCLAEINAGVNFELEAQIQASDTSWVQSAPFVLESPFVVFTDLTNGFFVGQQMDVFTRSFSLTNTGSAPVTSLSFSDDHQGEISISIPNSLLISQTSTSISVELGAAFFSLFGNGDDLFDPGESIVIEEVVTILGCGTPLSSTNSFIEAAWGCDNVVCQSAPQTAVVIIEESPFIPTILVSPSATAGNQFCGPDALPQSLLIQNTGTATANNLSFSVLQVTPGSGIDAGSFQVDSAGILFPLTSSPSDLFEALPVCQTPDTLFRKVDFSLPSLEPGDSVEVSWNTFFCSLECNQPDQQWLFDFRYEAPCPPGSIIGVDTQLVVANTVPFETSLQGPTQLTDGVSHFWEFQIQSNELPTTEGWLAIEWEVPCGLAWDANQPFLGGQLPDSLTLDDQDSLEIITFFYELPLSITADNFALGFDFSCSDLCTPDQICVDSLQTSCEQSGCETETPPSLPILVTTTLWQDLDAPPACQIQSCDGLVASYDCVPDSICIDTIPGYGLLAFTFERTSLGLADQNDDRLPDNGLPPDPDLIRLDRSIAGDTLRFQASGVVVTDLPGASFSQSFFNIGFRPQGIAPDEAAQLLNPNSGLILQNLSVQIFDQSENTSYTCSDPPLTIDSSGSFMRYQLALSQGDLAGCGLPADFLWTNGDSLEVEGLFFQAYNPTGSPSAPFPPLLQVSVQPSWALGTTDIPEEAFSCGCESQLWEISGYRTRVIPGVFTLAPCDTSDYQGASYLAFELAQGNFFPFEYRPLFRLDALAVGFPTSFNLQESRIQRLGHQGGPDWKLDTMINGSFLNNEWYFQLDSCQYPPADEGVRLLFQHRFAPLCPFPLNGDLSITSYGSALRTLPQADTVVTVQGSGSLKALIPNLQVSAPQPQQISFDNQVSWLINVTNTINTVIGQQSGTAPNVWIHLSSPTGLLTDLQLIDTLNGQPIPEVNGIFQLGDLDSLSSKGLLIQGLNQSCETEELMVTYGWNCDPVLDLADTDCFESNLTLSVLSPDGQLAINLNGPMDTCAWLCDTVPYHTLTLSNIDLGALCELAVIFELPTGLEYLPGSAQFADPVGSPFIPIPDPTNLGNGLWQYQLDSLSNDLQANCLPGVLADPEHTLQIRFLTLTNCDFTVNERIKASATGFQRCGLPANLVSTVGPPLCLNTDGPDPFTQFNAGLEETITCQDTALPNLVFAHSELTTDLDTLQVTLPPGIEYLPFSLNGVVNAPDEEPTIDTINNQQRLQWAFPAGLSTFSVVAFQVELAGFSSQPCGNYSIPVETFGYQNALCLTSGDTCLVRYQYGTSPVEYTIERPSWNLSNFNLNLSSLPDTGTYSIQLTNQGVATPSSAFLSLYYDWNGNQQFDSNDSLWQTLSFPGPLTDTLLSGEWTGNPADLCFLRAATRGDLHCSCEDDDIGLGFPVNMPVLQLDSVCPNVATPVELPLCLNAFDIAWNDTGGESSCDTCCSNELTWTNPSDTAWIQEQFTASLSNSEGCEFTIPFQVEVSPSPGIWTADTLVCAGETTQLVAFPALEYSWTGPGITNSNLPIQTPVVSSSAWYQLNAQTSAGCTTSDSIFVVALAPPLVEAGADTTFCPGDIPLLTGAAPSATSILWQPSLNLATPNNLTTEFLSPQTGWYQLNVQDDNGCSAADSIFVEFGDLPGLELNSDTTICLGDSLTLTATGAVTYEWMLSFPFSCLPPDCSSILYAPPTSDTILLTGTNQQGCSQTASLIVQVADESVFSQDTVTTCFGSPVDIFGTLTDIPGTYCDTLVLPSGCRQIECLTLEVQDTFFTQLDTILCSGDSLLFGNEYVSEIGSYVDLLTTEAGCDSLVQLNLTYFPATGLTAFAEPAAILVGESSTLSTNIVLTDPIWLPDTTLTCNACPAPMASPETSTLFTVTGLDEFGCVLSAQVELEVVRDCDPNRIELPNIFTPDGDGRNDTFFPLSRNGEEQVRSFRIWNRWGQIIHDQTTPWEGTRQGVPMPMDTYYYQVVIFCPDDGEEASHRGEITLIR
jgi:gliding motility-associated-like protein